MSSYGGGYGCGYGWEDGDGSGRGNGYGGMNGGGYGWGNGNGYGDGDGYGIGDGDSTDSTGGPARRPEHYWRDGSGDGVGFCGPPKVTVVAAGDDITGQVLLATWRCA